MPLSDKDLMEIREINIAAVPKWLTPLMISVITGMITIGIWAGTISNDVNELKSYREKIDPDRVQNASALSSIQSDLKSMRLELERTRYQVDVVNKDMKDFRKEVNTKLDHLDEN